MLGRGIDMARRLEKSLAIELRKQGKTYNEIIGRLRIPKGTLSGWLSDYPLTNEQLKVLERNIRERRVLSIERTIAVKHKKRQKRLEGEYERQKINLLPLSKKELLIAGLFLYWGEGRKGTTSCLSLNNTDPQVVKFYYYWLTNILDIPKDKVRVALHVYKDMNIEETVNYWSNRLNIPKLQFNKPYVKESLRSNINQKGFGHGTCGLYISNTRLKEQVVLGIQAISDFYSNEKTLLV